MTVTGLAEALFTPQAQSAFWILAGMTGFSFGFDPTVDILVNWEAAQRWRTWARWRMGDFQPGQWVYREVPQIS